MRTTVGWAGGIYFLKNNYSIPQLDKVWLNLGRIRPAKLSVAVRLSNPYSRGSQNLMARIKIDFFTLWSLYRGSGLIGDRILQRNIWTKSIHIVLSYLNYHIMQGVCRYTFLYRVVARRLHSKVHGGPQDPFLAHPSSRFLF